jgi:hypothetical protein
MACRTGVRCAMLAAWGLAAARTMPAQQLPLRAGDLARIAAGDSASQVLWRVGRVLWVTRDQLVLRPDNGGDSIGVALNPSVRLAVARPSPGQALLWGAGGLLVGAGLGGTVFSSAFDGETLAHGRAMEAMAFGAIGAVVGMVAGMAAGPRQWREIPLTDAGIAGARLTGTAGRPAQFNTRSYWTSFPTTEADFTAFFAAHQDSLNSLEGVWEMLGMTERGLTHPRVAIVRDSRYEGYDYVAVRLPAPGATFPAGRGLVTMAFKSEAGGSFVARSVTSRVNLRAELMEGELLLARADGSVEKWLKVYPAGP